MTAATEVVYDSAGVPAYAGQAIMLESCGNGGYCHSGPEIEPADRFGAPLGLSFNLRVASQTVETEDEESTRLQQSRIIVQDNVGLIWQQVSSGRMPPSGAAWEAYAGGGGNDAPPTYQRVDDDGVTFHDLPRLRALPGQPDNPAEAAEAREILRNWLACGAPVVERTQERINHTCNVTGDTVSVCERNCVYPSWESIYRQVVSPSCARSRCHDDTDPAEMLNLFADLSPPEGQDELDVEVARMRMADVVERITDAEAQGSLCRPDRFHIVVPNDPSMSLMYLKVSATSTDAVCGSRMPLSGNPLTEQRLCALSEWIRCGACSPTDAACIADAEACLDTPPEGVTARCGTMGAADEHTGVAACATEAECTNSAPPPAACR